MKLTQNFRLQQLGFKKIALWSGPRNISTAMMYSFANRKDTRVVDEPLFGYFLKHTNLWRPSKDEVLSTMEQDPKKILSELTNPKQDQAVFFMKHMANHLIDLDWSFLKGFSNIILTRHPKDVILSYSKHIKNPSMLDLCFEIQHELLNYLIENQHPAIVIDASQVLANPELILKKICNTLNINFSTKMLSWEPGPLKEDGVWAKYWYHNVHKSTCFGKYISSKDATLSKDLLPIYRKCLVHYNELLNHQLK